MSSGVFIINDRYRVYPALNQVQDMQTGHTIRLEPRIMAVLEHLSRRAGQLVSREEMIREIWHNYGGGDEGLSQAISFLRKTFGDSGKKLIHTVPKKGYQLTGTLATDEQKEPGIKPVTKLPYLQSLSKFAVLLYVIGTAAYFLYSGLYRQPQGAKQKVSFIAPIASRLLASTVRPAAKKITLIAANSKISPLTIHLKNRDNESTRALPVPAENHHPVLSAKADTKSYHLSDTTAQMITALDYQVTTQLRVSTAIN
ncbi:MAG: hypothetical protein JWR50_1141 [Mucilaginibacter sp.]|nr:hypothetical protein [Mucilaginibacter sp.]